MTFQSRSQAGQDQWVHDLLVKPDPNFTYGTFIDVGCGHPTEINNTYELEQLGWRGILMDVEQDAIDACVGVRKSLVVKARGESFDWAAHLKYFTRIATLTRQQLHDFPTLDTRVCDYLSLDCDEATNPVLRKLLMLPLRFRCITVEHDAYRFGDTLRAEQRAWLAAAGYRLVKADVAGAPGFPFEDWHIDPFSVQELRTCA